MLRDHTLQTLEILLDEAFPIPGTHIRFGLDGIIGLVPGLGDGRNYRLLQLYLREPCCHVGATCCS